MLCNSCHMSEQRVRSDHFITEQSSIFSHPRLSQHRIDEHIEYLSSALSDLQSRAGQLAEENTQLHHLLSDRSETDQQMPQQEREIPSKATVPIREDMATQAHVEKTPQGSLTAELGLLKEENSYLKSKLAVEETVHESLLTRVQQPSLCVVCHSSEAIYPLPSQQKETERETLLRKLTAEREECMRLLTALRDTLRCVREREREAIAQVKQSVDTSAAALEEKDRVLLRTVELEREIENQSKLQESLLSSAREQHEVELEGTSRESLHKYRELEVRLTQAVSDAKLRDGEISSLSQSKQVLERKLKSAQSEMFEADSKSMQTAHELRSRVGMLEAEKQNLSGTVESLRLEQEGSESRGAQELARARQEMEQQRAYLLATRGESAKLREHSLEAETERNKFKNQVRTLKYEMETLKGNTRTQLMKLEETHNLKCRKLIEEIHKLRDSNEVLKAALVETRERETQVVFGGQNELKRVQDKLERQALSLNRELEETKNSMLHLEIVHKQCSEDNAEFIKRSIEEKREIERITNEFKVLKEKRKEDTIKIKNLMTRQNNLLRERLQLCELLEQVYRKPEKERGNT